MSISKFVQKSYNHISEIKFNMLKMCAASTIAIPTLKLGEIF